MRTKQSVSDLLKKFDEDTEKFEATKKSLASQFAQLEPGAGISVANTFDEQDLALISQALLSGPKQSETQVTTQQSQDDKKRLAVHEMLNDPTLKLNFCDFDYIHALKPTLKDSASATSVFFGDVTRPPLGHSNEVGVAVKLALKEREPDIDNSLTIERVNYKIIANTIIASGWSPHIIAYVASFGCPMSALKKISDWAVSKNILKDLIPTIKRMDRLEAKSFQAKMYIKALEKGFAEGAVTQEDYDEKLEQLNEKIDPPDLIYDTNKLDFLITEKAINPKPLEKWIKEDISQEQFKSVLFQVLYTFEVFNRLRFRHNDCHFNNILIEDLSKDASFPMTSSYVIDDVVFNVPTKKNFAKIFDFDRSAFNCDPNQIHPDYISLINAYKAELVKHGLSDDCVNTKIIDDDFLCEDYGQCNGINSKYDTMLTLSFIREALKEAKPQIQMFDAWIYEMTEGAIPHLKPAGGFWLQSGYEPTDDEMPSTLQLLLSNFFNEFRASPSGITKTVYQLPKKPLNYP